MTATVQVRQKGQFTIPASMRARLGIEDNEIVSVSLVDNKALLVIPQKLKTEEIIKKTAELAKKRGVTLEEMLFELDEIRHHV